MLQGFRQGTSTNTSIRKAYRAIIEFLQAFQDKNENTTYFSHRCIPLTILNPRNCTAIEIGVHTSLIARQILNSVRWDQR